MRSLRLVVLGLGLSLVFVGCQSTPTVTPSPAPTSAGATPPATGNPVPTTAPPDVAALFADQATRLKSGVMTFSGTAKIGLVQVTLSGNSTYTGVDSKSKTIATVAGVPTVVESVQVAGKRYARNGDGPWLETPITNSGDLPGSLQKSALGSLTVAGIETRDGQTVHRLVPAANADFDPAALLGSLAGAEKMRVELAFFVTEDGLPVAATADARWTQASGGTSVEASMSFEVTFGSLGTPQTIRIPDNVWTTFESTRYGASLAYPGDFEYEKKKGFDQFWAPEYGGFSVDRLGSRGLSLTTWVQGTLAFYKSELRNETITNEAYTLDGVKARLLTAIGKNADGDKVVIYSAIAINGKYVYGIEWISLAGNEVVDRATFEDVLSTFAFTP